MRKKIFLIIIFVVVLDVCVLFYNILISNGELISKGEAIECIMKAIGANQDVKDFYEHSSYEIIPIVDGEEDPNRLGYLYAAVREHFIKPKEIGKYQYILNPKGNITFYELCEMISYALQENELEAEGAYSFCKDIGIIRFYETAFLFVENKYVSKKYFNIILKRFLNSKRYRYFMFESENNLFGVGYWCVYKDDYRAMTYNEYYNSEQFKLDRKYAQE